ncbi:oocyte zinc finger protein XlCOF6.1-like [Anopheles funestus]|uniref:oocyte zinc finger protein XlCOF6.1-like n=1 Tax=Anopheles funestus TaxID=62324 RepID=UPI0020C6E5C7|nr:oocyte zinc finger protein XlCOF6.1-like [Anopheles funestus]
MSSERVNPEKNLDTASVCRLCLSCDHLQFVSLHDVHQDVSLAEIINICFDIKIYHDDGLPQTVCNSCWKEVITYNELREKYLASDNILREAARNQCASKNYTNVQQLFHPCNPSKEFIKADSVILGHQHGTMTPIDDQLNIKNEEYESQHIIRPEPVSIDHKSTELTDTSELKQTTHNAKLFCCGCNPSPEFTSPEELTAHCDVQHTKYRITDNSIRPFECNICFQRFLTETLLKHHKDRPYRKRSYICGSCAAAYFTNSALKRHEQMCTVVDKNYTCEDCGKRFRQIITLKNHRKLHQTAKTFQCPVCSKTFKQKFEIPIHMVTHTGEQPYPCDQCPARFKRKQALKNHQHRHVNPRPFKCDACDEWFGNPTARKFHRQTVHEGLDPFRCEQCGLSYGRRVRLKQHMKKVHGESLDGD